MKTKLLAALLCAAFLASCAEPAVTPEKTDKTTDGAVISTPGTAPETDGAETEWPFELVKSKNGDECIKALNVPYKLKPDEKTWDIGDGYDYLRNNYPATDGSLIMKDYEAALKSVLYGISLDEARETISYAGTFGNNLEVGYVPENSAGDGKSFIFGTRFTKEQKRWLSFVSEKDGAYFKGIEVPLTVSALYIGVNASNPVEGLTSRQFTDIVSGKITNWKEVGGNDAGIVFCGTGEQTLTQNYLDELTGEKRGEIRLPDDPAELSEDPNAIFCTLYTFTSQDRLPDGVKYIAIDGVLPSRQSAADKSYPFLCANCLIYIDTASPYVGQYIEFAMKKEVREAAAKAGYVTYTPTDFVFESENEKPAEPYGGVGSGKVPDGAVLDAEDRGGMILTTDFSVIKNDSLKTEMIAFTEENLMKITDNIRACIIKNRNMANPAGDGSELSAIPDPIGYRICILNDCVSVTVGFRFSRSCPELSQNVPEEDYRRLKDLPIAYGATAVWRLSTGKRLTLEECFAEGVDIAGVLNRLTAKYTRRIEKYYTDGSYLIHEETAPAPEYYNADMSVPVAARDFYGLTRDDCWMIDITGLWFTDGNPWFDVATFVPLSLAERGVFVWDYESDNSAYLNKTRW